MTGEAEWLRIESLDLEAQGVARNAAGKVVFVDDALPGESVRVAVRRSKNAWEQASIVELRDESAQRVVPRCPHFGVCGGCNMQHLDVAAQVAVKQRALEDALWHLGKVRPERILRPMHGPAWGYRQRARLSVRQVVKKQTVLVGFHERKSSFVADIRSCDVLPRDVSDLLLPLRALIGAMATRDRLPQIELAVGDGVVALVLRHLEPLPERDLALLRAFASEHGVQWWLQPHGPDSARPLDGVAARRDDVVIDWFCGLGNFSLPLATRAARVVGVEGSRTLVERAAAAAADNGLAAKATFEARNLFAIDAAGLVAFGVADRWLVDPPREGAFAIAKALADLATGEASPAPAWRPPLRIVYVSCNPATLARDAGLLVHRAGYRCSAAGAVNMFPHTAHVESVAVFDRDEGGQ